ncbi:MAG: ABC transporter ATP-binding protein [Terriglobales bacterium]
MAPLLAVQNLTIEFPSVARASSPASAGTSPSVSPRTIAVVRDLSFSINPGEVLGLVGESGSGKSVTSLAIMGLLPPDANITGNITFQNGAAQPANLTTLNPDQLRCLRGSRIAMIFQEPMTALNPVMRVGDQIAEAVLAHNTVPPEIGLKLRNQIGNTNRELWNEWYRPIPFWFKGFAIPAVAFASLFHRGGIGYFHRARIRPAKAYQLAIQALRDVAISEPERRARSYPHQLSGGMRQRVMIAMAIVNRPQLLIADEPTTALDVTIQQQTLDLLNDLRQKFSLAMLFISHDLAVVSHVADRVAVMYAGNLVELAPKSAIFAAPAHPYTQGLLRAIPTLATDRAQPLTTIEGTVPPIAALPPGCPFEPRCEHRIAACSTELPPLVEVAPGHLARCPVVNQVLAPKMEI